MMKNFCLPTLQCSDVFSFCTLNDVHSKIDKDLILQDCKEHVQTIMTC